MTWAEAGSQGVDRQVLQVSLLTAGRGGLQGLAGGKEGQQEESGENLDHRNSINQSAVMIERACPLIFIARIS